MTEVLDVVQVGYGPVGQVLAGLLGVGGHRVEVVERHPSLYRHARAGHVDHEVMRMLQRIGATEQLQPDLLPTEGHNLMDRNFELLAGISVSRWGISGWRAHYSFYQPVFEAALDAAARAQSSVTVAQGWEAVSLEQHSDHVALTVRPTDPDDGRDDRVIRARYLIGVDGANSTVRRLAGLAWADLGYSGEWLVCDFEHHDPDVDLGWTDANHVLDPARPFMAGRWLGREHSRLEFMLLPGEHAEEASSEELVWQLSRRMNITPQTSKLVRHTVYQFRSRIAPQWRSGRVILAGDAAHLMPPFLGQGLCTGMRDVNSLAWKLDLILRGQAEETLLDQYVEQRRAHARMLIDQATELGGLLDILDPDAAAQRDASIRVNGLPPEQKLAGISAGVLARQPDGSLRAGVGELCLQALVLRDGRAGMLDDVIGAGWHVLCRRPPDLDSLSESQRAILASLRAEVIHLSPAPTGDAACDIDGDYHRWFGALAAEIVIVRPDFYAFAVLGTTRELPAALDELGRQLQLVSAA